MVGDGDSKLRINFIILKYFWHPEHWIRFIQIWQILPCGPGYPFLGQPNGYPSKSSSVYSCSIPNHGLDAAAAVITLAQVFLLFVSDMKYNTTQLTWTYKSFWVFCAITHISNQLSNRRYYAFAKVIIFKVRYTLVTKSELFDDRFSEQIFRTDVRFVQRHIIVMMCGWYTTLRSCSALIRTCQRCWCCLTSVRRCWPTMYRCCSNVRRLEWTWAVCGA